MNQRQKFRVSTRSPKAAEANRRFPWRLVALPMALLMIFAVTLPLFMRKPAGLPSPAKKDSNAPGKAGLRAGALSLRPPGSTETNEADSDAIDKASELVNRGTELLAQGKVDQAVAQYKEAARLSPEDEDMH